MNRYYFLFFLLCCIWGVAHSQYLGGWGHGSDQSGRNRRTLADQNTATMYGGGPGRGDHFGKMATEDARLPLTLLEFTATAGTSEVRLDWATADEREIDYFIAERSADGGDFTPLGTEKAVGGTAQSYHLRDASPPMGTSYYRIKWVAFDGSRKSSPLRRVDFWQSSARTLKLFPNPTAVGKPLTLQLDGRSSGEIEEVSVAIHDFLGQEIYRSTRVIRTGVSLDIHPAIVTPGLYTVRLRRSGGRDLSQSFTVIR